MASYGKRIVLSAAIVSISIIAGCASLSKQEVPLDKIPPAQIFQQAEAKLTKRRDAEEAAVLFTEVERLYPYSEWAKRSIIMSAFAYHQSKLYE